MPNQIGLAVNALLDAQNEKGRMLGMRNRRLTGMGWRTLTGAHPDGPEYPRRWHHRGWRNSSPFPERDCYPLLTHVGVNEEMLDYLCGCDVITFTPQSLLLRDDSRGWGVVREIRRRRPKVRIGMHAEVAASWQWGLEPGEVLRGFPDATRTMPDLANPSALESVSDSIKAWTQGGMFDFVLVDGAADNEWTDYPREAGGRGADYWRRYANGARFMLADLLDSGVPTIGNSGPGWCRDLAMGWCNENLPRQKPVGAAAYVELARRQTEYRAPWISLACRKAMATGPGEELVDPAFALGLACMGQAAYCSAPSDFRDWTAESYALPPEACVDRSTGQPDGRTLNWLGRSVLPAAKLDAERWSDLYWRPFEYGAVFVNVSEGSWYNVDPGRKLYPVGDAEPVPRFSIAPQRARFFLWQ